MTKPERSLSLPSREDANELARQWRTLRRAATFVALLTSPAVYLYLHQQKGWSVGWAIAGALVAVAAFRGAIDLLFRRWIPWPTLFGVEDKKMRDEDVTSRRRVWFWRFVYRIASAILVFITFVWVVRLLIWGADDASWLGTFGDAGHWLKQAGTMAPQFLILLVVFGGLNFAILFGPMVLMGVSQMRGFEPGDADWGVRLNDVRGQAEAKEEVRRIVSLWQVRATSSRTASGSCA